MSRHNAGCPIYALTPEDRVAAQDGAVPQRPPLFLEQRDDRDDGAARRRGAAGREGRRCSDGDLIVLTIGEPMGKSGGTNSMKIVRVGEHRTCLTSAPCGSGFSRTHLSSPTSTRSLLHRALTAN